MSEGWAGPLIAVGLLAAGALPVATAAGLTPLAGSSGDTPSAPWTFVGLPEQRVPITRFTVAELDGRRVLRVEAHGSYGNLLHPLADVAAGTLAWRWRIDLPLTAADLRARQGEDTALRVCAIFDLSREQVPFVERQLLRLAESRLGRTLPNAMLCYVWDPSWPTGSVMPSPYTRRVRFVTLGRAAQVWEVERRDLAADFLRAFGDESRNVPRLRAIAIGADADNTSGHSLAWIDALQLEPPARP